MPATNYSPSEAAIEKSIAGRIGSAGFFQRVAEQLTRGIYPHLASRIVPYGRITNDKTVAGWPDAYLVRPDGKLVAIEATTASDAESNHWKKDLARLKALPDCCGMVWVAWCDPSAPNAEIDMRRAAESAAPWLDHIEIVFRKELCSRLRDPIHARFWINDLGLSATSGPLVPIQHHIRRLSARQTVSVFPTVEQFETGLVHSPSCLTDIEKALEVQKSALVIGRGAAGKSTLAMLLAHTPRYRHAPTYYIDLSTTNVDQALTERAQEAIAATADHGVLFVLDNAHLDTGAAVSLLDQWATFGNDSDMLVLTRRVRRRSHSWDTSPEIESFGLPLFKMEVEPSDLEGVYQRHYWQSRGKDPPSVDPSIIQRWHRLFGGDLMSFSAAVIGLLESGGRADALLPEHAREYVRKQYLENPELAPERSSLLAVAAVAEAEGFFPSDALPSGALDRCVRQGIVWVENRGSRRSYEGYQLPHPGLGTLLRSAAGESESSIGARCRILAAHPHSCLMLASSLLKRGEENEAADLVAAMWQHTNWPFQGLPFHWWSTGLDLTRQLNILSAAEISRRCDIWLSDTGASGEVLDVINATSLGNTISFWQFAERALPRVSARLRSVFVSQPEVMTDIAVRSPLPSVWLLLTTIGREVPSLSHAIERTLIEHGRAFMENALVTSFNYFPTFIRNCRLLLPQVYTQLTESIAERPEAAVERILGSGFNASTAFLAGVGAEAPEAHQAICEALSRQSRRVADRAVTAPLPFLVDFLQFSQKSVPGVISHLRHDLAEDRGRLLDLALSSFAALPEFLAFARAELPDVATILEEELSRSSEQVEQAVVEVSLDAMPQIMEALQPSLPYLRRGVHSRLGIQYERLLDRAMATPIHQLVPFLLYLRPHVPQVAELIDAGLAAGIESVQETLLNSHPPAIASYLQCVFDNYPKLAAALKPVLVGNAERMAAAAFEAPLAEIAPLLAFAESRVPILSATISEYIEARPNELRERMAPLSGSQLAALRGTALGENPLIRSLIRERMLSEDEEYWVREVIGTPLNYLPSLLEQLKTEIPGIGVAVRRALIARYREVASDALGMALGDARVFLEYAFRKMPELARSICWCFTKEPKRLVSQAVNSSLDHLVSFLQDCEPANLELVLIIHDGLLQNQDRVTKTALETPFDHLAAFLRYTKDRIPQVHARVETALALEANRALLEERCLATGPEAMAPLLGESASFVEVLRGLVLEQWTHRWSSARIASPSWFRGFATACYKAERGDLAAAIADAIIRKGVPQDFPSDTSTIVHLSFILCSQHCQGEIKVNEFVRRCIREDWLIGQYTRAASRVGSLAGAIRAVALDERPWVRNVFCRNELWARIQKEQPGAKHNAGHVAAWLQLFGAGRLLKPDLLLLKADALPDVEAALRQFPPGPPDQGIQQIQASMWFGLKEWYGLQHEVISLSPTLGDGILAQFKAAAPPEDSRIAKLNLQMVAWLEECRGLGWTLAGHSSPSGK